MHARLARLQGWHIPLILLGLVLLSYGLWIPWLGLFGNDLPYLWYYHVLGPWGPGVFAASDRPVSALFYAAATGLLGERVWPYHLFLLGLRWLSAVLLWGVLGLVWPARKREAALAAVLFSVYPGFRQNPIALEFILHFFVLDLFLLSLGSMLLAFCRPRQERLLQAVAMAGAAGLFFNEYFIGLELMRPVFLWLLARQQGLTGRARGRRVLRAWLPALLVVAAFVFWRVAIFSFPTYRPVLFEMLRTNPPGALAFLIRRAAQDVWVALGGAWLQTLPLANARRLLPVYAGLALASTALVALLWQSLRKHRPPAERADRWGETALGLGLLLMLAGGAVFWLTGIPITLAFPWDRSTLPLMLGASLALAGLLEMLVVPRYRMVLAGGLVALAVGMHFINAAEYRAEWAKLQDFSWQLTWRAPGLEPGSLLLFEVLPLNRYSDNDLTALLNWIYAPDSRSLQIAYKFFDLTLRLDAHTAGLPGLEKDLPVVHNHRGTSFKSTTSSTLALIYNPPACLKLLAAEDALWPDLPERLQRALPLTRIQQVRAGGAPGGEAPARPPAVLGEEPAHGWCYYFQKAELARQQGDWARLVSLADQAFDAGLQPGSPAELLPMIEGYARVGQWERAAALSRQAARQASLQPALCAVWQRVGQAPGQGAAVKTAAGEREALGCSP